MDLLLILTYTAICTVIFKVFRIPLNKWSVPTAALGGVVLIGGLLLIMNYNHPYAEVAREYFRTTPMVPQVRGRVIEIPVQPNQPMAEGEVLFRIDPKPYQEEVDRLMADLERAHATRDDSKVELDRTRRLVAQAAASERELNSWQLKYDTALADIKRIESEIDRARFDLDNTVVRAPAEGMVVQLTLDEGMMAGITAVRPVMTFMPTDQSILVGWFRQNSLLRLQPGEKAEVAFDAVPGVIFQGEVTGVMPAIAEGQLMPTADLINFDPRPLPGRIPVQIRITDPAFAEYDLPEGVFAQAAVYSEHFHHVAVLRKVLLRMSSWMNYVFPLH